MSFTNISSASSSASSNSAIRSPKPSTMELGVVQGTTKDAISEEMEPVIRKVMLDMTRDVSGLQAQNLTFRVDASGTQRKITALYDNKELGEISVDTSRINQVAARIIDLLNIQDALAENRQEYEKLSGDYNKLMEVMTAIPANKAEKRKNLEPEAKSIEGQLIELDERFKSLCCKKNKTVFKAGGLVLKLEDNAGRGDSAFWPAGFTRLAKAMLDKVPEVSLEGVSTVCTNSKPVILDHNNYGLAVDDELYDAFSSEDSGANNNQSIQEAKTQPAKLQLVTTFDYNGKTYQTPKNTPVFLWNGQVFASDGSAKYHDHGEASEKFQIMNICDGCGHSLGTKRLAAKASKKALIELENGLEICITVARNEQRAVNLRDVLKAHVDALKKTQEKLVQERQELGYEGTTLAQVSISGDVVSGIAVGDSQVFAFIPKENSQWEVQEISGEGKTNLEPRNCGGRLSEETKETSDLLTGLRIFAKRVPANTIIFSCSDGVVDCLDPSINHSKTPKDYGASETEWDTKNSSHIPYARAGICENMTHIISGCKDANQIVKAVKKAISQSVEGQLLHQLTTGNNDYIPKDGEIVGKADDAVMGFMVVGDAQKSAPSVLTQSTTFASLHDDDGAPPVK